MEKKRPTVWKKKGIILGQKKLKKEPSNTGGWYCTCLGTVSVIMEFVT